LTYGGAERWYRVLVDRFVETGATVTYLTRRQWPLQPPAWTGVNIVAVGGDSELYDSEGTRRTGPAMMFGIGTFIWLLRHRRKFDAVVVASFPYFSLLAARAALVGTSTPIFVDYLEVWSPQYWKFYAGRVTGTLGVIVQKLCIRVTQFAQVFVEENAQRLRAMDYRGDVAVLAGLLPGDRIRSVASESPPEGPTVLFVGRHVKHKGVRLLPAILSVARESIPDLKMTIVSDGPERSAVEREVHELGLNDYVTFAGPVSDDDLPQIFANASCTVVPSLREGYGIVVVESVSAGTPVVVANNPENLATGLVAEGINGFVVEPSIRAMAEGIVTAIVAGAPLRHSAADWSVQHSAEKSINRSADEMVERISTVSNRQSK
jgi:glycosyltransferase involved in cell wall biosynthesis